MRYKHAAYNSIISDDNYANRKLACKKLGMYFKKISVLSSEFDCGVNNNQQYQCGQCYVCSYFDYLDKAESFGVNPNRDNFIDKYIAIVYGEKNIWVNIWS